VIQEGDNSGITSPNGNENGTISVTVKLLILLMLI
jgi:hypothetical protein